MAFIEEVEVEDLGPDGGGAEEATAPAPPPKSPAPPKETACKQSAEVCMSSSKVPA